LLAKKNDFMSGGLDESIMLPGAIVSHKLA
jgi:hypothetical protein